MVVGASVAGPLHVASAQNLELPPRFYLKDMARGLRFEPPLMCLHFPRDQPNRVYVGNRFGRVYQSVDFGESWLEGSVLTPRTVFLGGVFSHRSAPFSGHGILNAGILPSPGQLFSFRNLLDLNQRLPQVGGLVRSYFNAGFNGDPTVSGFLEEEPHERSSYRLYAVTRRKYKLRVAWRDPVAKRLGQNIEVRSIETPLGKPNEIIVGTGDGLYHSRDGGDSFPISFSGVNQFERLVNIVRVHPQDSREIWIGTTGGLRISRDGGLTYQTPTNRFVLSSYIKWITFHPHYPDTAYIATGPLLLETRDRGRTFRFKYYFKTGYVSRIFVDPHRPERILLGTTDGLMISTDGGRKFTASGELLFVGQKIVDVEQGFNPGHYFVATKRDLWQTFDGGATWQIAYFGSVDWFIRRVVLSPHNPNELWILTSAEILKLSYQAPPPVDRRRYQQLLEKLRDAPTMSEIVNATLKRAGVHRGDRMQIRSFSRMRGLLPRIDAFYVQRSAPVDFQINNFLLKATGEVTNDNTGSFDYSVWGAFASWDLSQLIHSRSELPNSEREERARKIESNLRTLVINLYQERVNLIASLELDPRGPRVTLMRRLRLEELTAHINVLSGDLLIPFKALDTIQESP